MLFLTHRLCLPSLPNLGKQGTQYETNKAEMAQSLQNAIARFKLQDQISGDHNEISESNGKEEVDEMPDLPQPVFSG